MKLTFEQQDLAGFDRLKPDAEINAALRRLITQRWNICSRCNTPIPDTRPAFAGYATDGTPLYVGACCTSELASLATPVYWSNSLNLSVSEDQVVWRYMDTARFLAMLKHGGLYLPRADRFDDRFEGALGLAAREEDWARFYVEKLKRAITDPALGVRSPTEQIESEARELLLGLQRVNVEARQSLVSCWHGNDGEAEALWRLYCPPASAGVAVRSTVGRLWNACAVDSHAIVGRVHYVDYKKAFASLQKERIFQKRQSLSHEAEIRIVLPNDPLSPVEGRLLLCDLEALIVEVVVSPYASNWFFEVIGDVVAKYGYKLNLRQSELLDDPFY